MSSNYPLNSDSLLSKKNLQKYIPRDKKTKTLHLFNIFTGRISNQKKIESVSNFHHSTKVNDQMSKPNTRNVNKPTNERKHPPVFYSNCERDALSAKNTNKLKTYKEQEGEAFATRKRKPCEHSSGQIIVARIAVRDT